jgi:transcriptional regulator with GAF, ATPase, and Fis domain
MVGVGAPSHQLAGRYVLLGRAGAGGSAEVHRARRESDGALVALKVAREAGGSLPLSREALHAALTLSPRLPELIDLGWGVLDGERFTPCSTHAPPPEARAFLALRWIEGAPLDRAPRAERDALALAVARDVGEALADLHALGLAHGDIKPENLLLDAQGKVHVLDLGLAGAAHSATPEGATLRYLALRDRELGDARARDLLALGLVLAELADPAVVTAADPLAAARRATLPAPLDALCAALLSPSPGARPSAAWVAEMAGAGPARDRAERDARLVRASYLRLRRHELGSTTALTGAVAPWLALAVEQAARARTLAGPAADALASPPLGPLSLEQRARWLTALVGSPAAAWPLARIAEVAEPALADALVALARRSPPAAWTLAELEAAALGEAAAPSLPEMVAAPSISPDSARDLDLAEAARLALAISRVPPDALALLQVERRADAPPVLQLAAADALRLRGELGRARSLIVRLDARADRPAGLGPLGAEILRRSGDLDLADGWARRAVSEGRDPEGRARAIVGRLALDRGDLAFAAHTLEGASSAPLCEAAALVAAARGEIDAALAELRRGEALATSAEERARLAGARGYVLHGRDPEGTLAAYTTAVDHAVRSGAVVEEASYRTGEAAAAADLGDLGVAIASGRRAALLWEHLGRPALAARALLAAAAAWATAGAAHEAEAAAREALGRARDGGDRRAEAYARWVLSDLRPAGDAEGLAEAEAAAALLLGAGPDDELRAWARRLRHRSPALLALEGGPAELDRRAAAAGPLGAAARLEWWGARAAQMVAAPSIPRDEAPRVLLGLTALADARAEIAARGPALAEGHALALRLGDADTAARLLASLREATRVLLDRAPADLAAAVRALPWVALCASAPGPTLRPEQARDLEGLIRSFSDHERLGQLLRRILDALVLWTGVERGLLLLRAPDNRLVPRAARNLARADLTPEQMTLSRTLAHRALEAGEPVIAVDAAGELPSVHQSVHALKLRSVLAIPLIARGEALGVAYLDDRVRRGAFGPREIEWARTIASLAALVIADARDQVLLRRAARRATRASARIAETLAQREAALDLAERELGRIRGSRETRFKYEKIIGESAATRAMLKIVDRVTASEVPVLLSGESGSGKELIARAIHENGPRGGRPFVSENCGAIPEGLLESTLFGHVRGAFTGASVSRAGLFEVAHTGTLFLDEIGEMSLGMQTKLLRVLEDGLVRPVGSERARKVDVRIIAATHRDLEAMVKAKSFREDLFYRLNIITIRIPPLRERADDIPLLVRHLLDKHGDRKRPTPLRVTPAAMDRLMAFAWPGNVRQLENEIRRAMVLSDGVIDEEQLSAELGKGPPPAPREAGLDLRKRIDALELNLVKEAMERTGNNQTQAAKLLGLSRFGLQKMIKRLAIR